MKLIKTESFNGAGILHLGKMRDISVIQLSYEKFLYGSPCLLLQLGGDALFYLSISALHNCLTLQILGPHYD